MKILIADDNEIDRKVLQGLLKHQGECKMCSDGKEAIAAFTQAIVENAPFNLVCLDISMPELDGKEVLKAMRSLEKENGLTEPKSQSIVVMTTGHNDVKQILNSTKLGCNGYLTKPIDQERLLSELGKLGLKLEWDTKPKNPFANRD